MNLRLPQPSDVSGKTVLVRVDYNVPLDEVNGKMVIEDDKRIVDTLETLNFLLTNGAKVVLLAHLGRPEGNDLKLSLAPIAKHMRDVLKLPVTFVADTIGDEAQTAVQNLQPSQVLLLENLRYHDEEEKNDPEFAKQLATLGDVYINEAFSAAHRAHASITGVPQFLPSFAGFALEKEVKTLTHLIGYPDKPLVVVLGGAKISDKVGAVQHLADIADIVLVGGAVANNFLKAEGLETHKSFLEEASSDLKKQGVDYVEVARKLIEAHKSERMLMNDYIPLPKILYPIDVLAAPSLETTDPAQVQTLDLSHDMEDTPNDQDLLYLDIGPRTRHLYQAILQQAGTIFWNGPMGVWENELFASGTRDVGTTISQSPAYTVIGGGDTIAAVDHFGIERGFKYISAAGGAALDFLSGKTLPGIEPLISPS